MAIYRVRLVALTFFAAYCGTICAISTAQNLDDKTTSKQSPVQVTAGDTTVQLSWDAPPEHEVDSYRIYREGSDRPLIDTVEPRFHDIGLSNGTVYTYLIVAVLSGGEEWKGYALVSAIPKLEPTPAAQPAVAYRPGSSGIEIQLPDGVEYVWKWEIVKYGEPTAILKRSTEREKELRIGPGKYQIALTPDQHYTQLLIWPARVEVKVDQITVIQIDSGVKLELPQEVPGIYAWRLVDSQDPEKVVHYKADGVDSGSMLIVPPGEYGLVIQQHQYYGGSVRWPANVNVQPGEFASVQIDSGVKLELPQEVPRIHAWRLVDSQDPEKVVHYKADGVDSGSMLIVPPGEYGLVIQQHQYYGGSVRWPANVNVQPGEFASVQIDSGVKLELPQEVPRIHAWRLVDSQDPEKVVHYKADGVDSGSMLIVPPGEYGLVIQQHQYYGGSVRWPANVNVQPGEFASVQIDSGVKLELPQEVPRIHAWRLVDSQDPEKVVHYKADGVDSGSMLIVPPGVYGVSLRLTQFGPWKNLSRSVNVERGMAVVLASEIEE